MNSLTLEPEAGVPLLFPIADVIIIRGLSAIVEFVKRMMRANTRSRPPFIDVDRFVEVLLARADMIIFPWRRRRPDVVFYSVAAGDYKYAHTTTGSTPYESTVYLDKQNEN